MAQEVKYLSYSGLSYFKDRVFEVINPLISENKANILSIQNFLEKPVFEEVNINTLNVIDEINLNGTRLFNFDFLPLSGGIMTGTITSQSIIPAKTHTTSDTAYSLGSSSKQFNTTYTRYVDTVSGYNLRLKAGGTEHLNMLSGTVNSTANIIPTSNNTYNLGSSSLKWSNVYSATFTGTSASLTGPLTITGTDGTTAVLHFGRASYNYISGPSGSTIHMCPGGISRTSTTGYIFSASEFYPGTTNAYSIGSSSKQWNNIYGKTLYENGTSLASKYAAASHNHSAANITSGTLSVSRGGTGLNTIPTDHVILGNGTGTPTTAKIAELSDDEIDAILINLGVTI